MGCHGNHAFSHMPNWFIYGDFLSRLGDPREQSCTNLIFLGRANFWPQGHNSNKLGRGPLGDATYQIIWLYALWFQKKIVL